MVTLFTQEELNDQESFAYMGTVVFRVHHDISKQDPNLRVMTASMMGWHFARKAVLALADCLATNPIFQTIYFMGSSRIANGNDGDVDTDDSISTDHDDENDEFAPLVTAMAESPLLRLIFISNVLPLKLGGAIVQSLKQKSTFTTLAFRDSSFLMRHATAFGELLASATGLGRLELDATNCYDVQGTTIIRDGLQKSQSLKEIEVGKSLVGGPMEMTCNCILEALDGNESLEKLTLEYPLNSDGASLLNKVVSSHPKLASLKIHVPPDCMNDVYDAVAQSQSITELHIEYCGHDSAISNMLQQTTSLQKLHLDSSNDCTVDVEKLVDGLKACQTLTTLVGRSWMNTVNGTRALLEAIIVNLNIKEVQLGDNKRRQNEQTALATIRNEVYFYLAFNEEGRALLGASVSSNLWPHIFAKAGQSTLLDGLYFFIHERPELVMHAQSSIRQPILVD